MGGKEMHRNNEKERFEIVVIVDGEQVQMFRTYLNKEYTDAQVCKAIELRFKRLKGRDYEYVVQK